MTAQLRLDQDTTRTVDLDGETGHVISSMLRASAAALEQYPLRSTNAVEHNTRARHCATARRVAAELDGLIPDDEDRDEAA